MCIIPDDITQNLTFIIYHMTFSATSYFRYNRNHLSSYNQYVNANICNIYFT